MFTHSITIDIHISAAEYLKLYEGVAKNVNARSRDGRRIQFPAAILQPYVTHSGVKGSFVIDFDQAMKFQGIRRF